MVVGVAVVVTGFVACASPDLQTVGQADSAAHPHNVTAYSCDNNYLCDHVWDDGTPHGRHGDSRAVISSRNTYDDPTTMAVGSDYYHNGDGAGYFKEHDLVWVESLGWFAVEDTCDACNTDIGRLDLWIGYGNDDDASKLTRILSDGDGQYQVRVFHPGEYVPPDLKGDEAGSNWKFDEYISTERQAVDDGLGVASWLWVAAGQDIWGDRLVDGLVAQEPGLPQSSNNFYDTPNSYLWGPYDSPPADHYYNWSKCSTFVAELLRRGRHMTNTYLSSWLGSSNPYAVYFWNAIGAADGRMTAVTKVGDILPGDIIAINEFAAPPNTTGHVAVIEPFPESSSLHGELLHQLTVSNPLAGVDYWAVTIDDTTSTPHANYPTTGTPIVNDTRHGGVGAGRAVMRLLSSQSDGTILGYSWSYNNSSQYTYLNSDTAPGHRNIRIGRIKPDQDFAPGTPPPAASPILHYELEGNGTNTGTTAGYNIDFTGTPSYGAGKIGQAVTYGSGGYGRVASAPSVLGIYPAYTISFWALTSTQPNDTTLIDFNNRYSAPYGGVQLAQNGSTINVCIASTSNPFLGGSCLGFPAPTAGAWHNYIVRYAGTGTGAGQGAGVDIYVDDVLVHSQANDAANDPVFNSSILSTLQLGSYPYSVDDVRVYNQVFTVADQCTTVLQGAWTGSSCSLP